MLCFGVAGNIARLKSISKKRLSLELKLATGKGRQLTAETLVPCFITSGNTTRLKNISRELFSSQLKLETEKERQLTTVA